MEAKVPTLSGADHTRPYEGIRAEREYWTCYQTDGLAQQLDQRVREWKAVLKNISRGDDSISWDRETRALFEIFQMCDFNGDQKLEWDPAELRNFVRRAFQQHNLPGPYLSEQVWLTLYRDHDSRSSTMLEGRGATRFDMKRSVRFLMHVAESLQVLAAGRGLPVQAAPGVYVLCRQEEQYYDSHTLFDSDELREASLSAEECRNFVLAAEQATKDDTETSRRRDDQVQQSLALELLSRQEEEAQRTQLVRRAAEQVKALVERHHQLVKDESFKAECARRMAVKESKLAMAARQHAEDAARFEKERRSLEVERQRLEDEGRKADEEQQLAERELAKGGGAAPLWREKSQRYRQDAENKKKLASTTEELRAQKEKEAKAANDARKQTELEARGMLGKRLRAEADLKKVEVERRAVEADRAAAEEEYRYAEELRREAESLRRKAQSETHSQKQELEANRKSLEEKHKRDREHAREKEQESRLAICQKLWRKAPTELRVRRDWFAVYEKHVEAVADVLFAWEQGHIQNSLASVFADVDCDRRGLLEWNNSEIRDFVTLVFQRSQLPDPHLEERNWYRFFRQFAPDGEFKLDFNGCDAFAKLLHEEVAKRGVKVGALDAKQSLELLQERLDTWDGAVHTKQLQRIFHEVDVDADGFVTWNDSELRSFVRRAFDLLELPTPCLPEQVWYQIYREVDFCGQFFLKCSEAIHLVRHLLRRILEFYPDRCSASMSTMGGGETTLSGLDAARAAAVAQGPAPATPTPRSRRRAFSPRR